MCPLEAVHHRTFDLGKVKPDPSIGEPVIDRLQTLEAGRVDFVYRTSHQDHVLHFGLVGDSFEHVFFQPPRI